MKKLEMAPQCGDCNACCIVMRAVTLDKPEYTPCAHLATDVPGCGIYDTRPRECEDFACAYLRGVLPEVFRPDRSGFIVFGHDDGHLIAQELWPGATRHPDYQPLLQVIADSGIHILVVPPPDDFAWVRPA